MYSTQLAPSRWLQSWRSFPALVPRTCICETKRLNQTHAVTTRRTSVGGQLHTGTALNSFLQHSIGRRCCKSRTRVASSSSSVSAAKYEDTDHGKASSSSSSGHQVPPPGKPLRVERLLANLGYGKRSECTVMIKKRRLVYAATGTPAKVGEKAYAGELLLDGEPLDPPTPLNIILSKPAGYVVTSPDDENVLDPKVYDLLPYRFCRRRPFLSCVGRLDKETSGLLLLTDDGKLLHSIQSPARGIWKVYQAELDAPFESQEAATAAKQFSSGRLQLQGDRTPLLPAALRMLGPTTAEVAICEGRYHQIRRMFAAVGRQVVGLHRHAIGGLRLISSDAAETDSDGDEDSSVRPLKGSLSSTAVLSEGSWKIVATDELKAVFQGPDSLDQIQQQWRL